jgi:PadR family transcriptional regulator, regulatory protein PadR
MNSYLGEFEQLILFSALHLAEEACGVTIRESIEERTGRVVSSGAIYTALGRLEERELVTSTEGPATPGPGRPRKYYAVTPEGARALLSAYSTMQAMAGGLIPRLAELADR